MKKINLVLIFIFILGFNISAKDYWEEKGWVKPSIWIEEQWLNKFTQSMTKDQRDKFEKDIIEYITEKLDKAFREGIKNLKNNPKAKCFEDIFNYALDKDLNNKLEIELKGNDTLGIDPKTGKPIMATGRCKGRPLYDSYTNRTTLKYYGYIELGNIVGNKFNPKHSTGPCLEGVLFHESLHAINNNYDETIAHACSHTAFPCAPLNNYNKGDCDCQKERKHRNLNKTGRIISGINTNDNPDDNYSYASGNLISVSDKINALIYREGNFDGMDKMAGGLFFDSPESPDKLFKISKLILIPSLALSGKQNNSGLKVLIREYLSLGGSVLIMAQQYGLDIDQFVPFPVSESIKSYGFREDQSCYMGSIYYDNLHPIVSSSPSEQITAAVDGYFTAYPSNSTVILNRTKNREAALLFYPYGDNGGHVILTSLFTDSGSVRSQASASELKIMRDLITFAKDPKAIPMFNLEANPAPGVTLDVLVKNNTEETAAKVKLIASTPDRDLVLCELEQSISINTGEEAEIFVSVFWKNLI
jgi:hypothetical protein